MDTQPPLGPLKCGVARKKSLSSTNNGNHRRLGRVSLAYTIDYEWRSQGEFFNGLATIERFLKRAWVVDSECRHTKTVWCCSDKRVAVTFEYEWLPTELPGRDAQ
jgi:nuclear transport factor 2 (NTF2) superfamily protein